jgi:hypothetical protein
LLLHIDILGFQVSTYSRGISPLSEWNIALHCKAYLVDELIEKWVDQMNCQVGELSSWWIVKLMNFQVDELSSWWIFKLMNCQVDGLSSWWIVMLMNWEVDTLSSWRNYDKLMR